MKNRPRAERAFLTRREAVSGARGRFQVNRDYGGLSQASEWLTTSLNAVVGYGSSGNVAYVAIKEVVTT